LIRMPMVVPASDSNGAAQIGEARNQRGGQSRPHQHRLSRIKDCRIITTREQVRIAVQRH
jgi:hypothetical protein